MIIIFEKQEENLDEIKDKEYFDEAYEYFFASDENDNILGALGYIMDDGIFSIEVLYVEPAYRGHRIATHLIHRASSYAIAHDCTQVLVSAILDYGMQDKFSKLMLSQSFLYPEFGAEQYRIEIGALSQIGFLEKEIICHTPITMEQIQSNEVKDCKKLMMDILNPDYMASTIGTFESDFSFRLVDKGKNIISFIIVSTLPNGDLYIDACMLKKNSYAKEFMKMLQCIFQLAVKKKAADNKIIITTVSDSSRKLVEHFFENADYKKYIYAETMKLV